MLSQTRQALEAFDNDHDFERMCADILNALGYSDVEPVAPGGGSDGGQDIRFMDGEVPGVALVTLDKGIESKFRKDLAKQPDSDGALIFQFCSVSVSPKLRHKFAQAAMAKGYELQVFDLERLRSLLDGSLKEIRRRYLHIDDGVSEKLRAEIKKLLRFPDAATDTSPPTTAVERMLADPTPRRLFDLLLGYDEVVIAEVPGAGNQLHAFLQQYYQFRQAVLKVEAILTDKIGTIVACRFRRAWAIYLQYLLLRAAGNTQDQIKARGNFLNYDISWADAERVFVTIAASDLAPLAPGIFIEYENLVVAVLKLKDPVAGVQSTS